MTEQTDKKTDTAWKTPWWLTVSTAFLCYYLLKYFIPTIPFKGVVVKQMAQAAPDIAPIVAIILLLIGAKQLYEPTDEKNDNTGKGKKDKQDNDTKN